MAWRQPFSGPATSPLLRSDIFWVGGEFLGSEDAFSRHGGDYLSLVETFFGKGRDFPSNGCKLFVPHRHGSELSSLSSHGDNFSTSVLTFFGSATAPSGLVACSSTTFPSSAVTLPALVANFWDRCRFFHCNIDYRIRHPWM